MTKRIPLIILALVFTLGISSIALAKSAEQGSSRIVKTSTKELTGTISGISIDSISLVYKEDKQKGIEYEILLPLNSDIEIQHKKSLKDFNVGDMASVAFDEVVIELPGGEKKVERKIKMISFVRSADKKPETAKLPEPGEGLPDDI